MGPATSSTRSKPCARAVGGATDLRDPSARWSNLGHDADTTAAIAGQLAGARAWGHAAIPEDWRRWITDGDRIAAIAGRLFDLGAGLEPSHPWIHDEVVHGYWVEPGRILAASTQGRRTRSQRPRAKVDRLVDEGIRTFVDLTTADDAMAPYEDHVGEVAERRGVDLRRIHHPIPDMGTLPRGRLRRDRGDRPDRVGPRWRLRALLGRHRTHRYGRRLSAGRRRLSADAALTRLEALRTPTRKGRIAAPQTGEQIGIVRRRGRTI